MITSFTGFSSIVAIIMAFITMLTSVYGSVSNSLENKQSNFPVQDFEEKADDCLRIMSFNVRCTNVGTATAASRHGIVAETIKKGHPDSVGVQEATPSWMEALKLRLGDEYAYVGVGRDDGDNNGEYSAIFYLKDKYEPQDSGTFWLSETPDKPSMGWDAACRRVCTWVVLKNKTTGETYVHLNSHFDHIGQTARSESVKMILAKASEYPDLPVVFTADMNVVEGSKNYQEITADGTLRDTKHLAPDTMDCCTYHDTKPEMHDGDVIDYVLINKHFDAKVYRVVTAGIDGKFVSDHYPIYADIVIK